MVNLKELLYLVIEKGASDLHLTVGVPPKLRIDGVLTSVGSEILTPDTVKDLIFSILTEEQKEKFNKEWELDFAIGIKELSRFRINIFKQRGCISVAIRSIPFKIPTFHELGLPHICDNLVEKRQGFILVTGPTGSGKSTTLASMVDKINENRSCHIITIEDPIEYLHHHKKAIINQREVGSDTKSFPTALKYTLREDPNVILIGEMRDLETIRAAITIAETGHLVFATLHTPDTIQSINRIIDVFPPHQQTQVKTQLSFVLEGILSQQLLPRHNSAGRILSLEVLIPTPAIRSLIREDKLHQIYSSLQTGHKYGMQSMNYALSQLYLKNLISYEEALIRSSDPEELQSLIKRHFEKKF